MLRRSIPRAFGCRSSLAHHHSRLSARWSLGSPYTTGDSGKPLSFPFGSGAFEKIYTQPNTFFVDKSKYLWDLENEPADAFLSFRPRRMGKTLFKNMLAYYVDKNNSQWEEQFRSLEVYKFKDQSKWRTSSLVLNLTLAGMKTDTFEKFEMSLNEYLNGKLAAFSQKYPEIQFALREDAIASLQNLIDAAEAQKEKIFVLIDEYDTAINTVLHLSQFTSQFSQSSAQEQTSIEKMESLYKQMFSRFKSACDQGVARVFLTGVTPLVLTEFTSGFNNAIDLNSDRWAFMYGFSHDDMKRGIDSIGNIPAEAKAEILKIWERDFDGYRFHPRANSGLFNPTLAMYNFHQVRERLELGNLSATSPELVRQLLDFFPAHATLPAETTLRVISQHPLGRETIKKALTSPTLELSSPVMSRFRLSTINELSTNTDALLSFMFYTGALTYCPPTDSKRMMSAELKVTNETARTEFWNEALRFSSWLSSKDLRKKVSGAAVHLR